MEEENEEKYEDDFSEEFLQKAKSMKIQPIQLLLVEGACKSFKERNKCNIDCIYLNYHLCPDNSIKLKK